MNTKDKILEAAREEFLANGYDATSVRCIADKADINKGLLHYYFKTKEVLIVQVFEELFKELFSILDQIFDADQRLELKVEQAVNEYISFMLKRPRLPVFILSEMDRDPAKHILRLKRAKVRPPFLKLIQLIEDGKKSGEVRRDLDARHFILSLISLTLFPFVGKPMLKYFHDLDEQAYQELIEQRKKEITDLLIKSLKP
ncbi:MAG: TetR/AcrR family transcriptional regulator [Flavobacteriales bacterium]|nr:TetR/AcrR family transcriptional regulator [Flavobacteriales bacterium]